MRRTLFIIGATLALAGNAQAAGSPAPERIGVGIGVTVGAFAGGPVGAIIGGAIGARFGDSFDRKNREIDELTGSLAQSGTRVSELERTVRELNRDVSVLDSDLRRLQAQSRPELLALLQAGIDMDLLFRTDEHVLTDDTRSRIGQLATTLAGMPDVQVQLDGYADERGDEAYNRTLSDKRAQHIRDLLTGHGVDASRITVTAHGEVPASEPGTDNYALQRKVALRLFVGDAPSVALSRSPD